MSLDVLESRSANERRVAQLLERRWSLSIGGQAAASRSGRWMTVVSPYSEEPIAEVPDGTPEDADLAVRAAADAFPMWRRTTVLERAGYVTALTDAIEERLADFALLDSIDSGAPIEIMLMDIRSAVRSLRYFAGIGMETKGATIPASNDLHYTLRQPYGVVAKIIPFNHPILFAGSKIGAPLMAGNTVVLKPAETTPLSALLLGELLGEVLPRGVASVVVGDGPAVPDSLVRHPLVHRIGFTGSESVGRSIQRSAAEVGVKHVSLELGGKNALIAFPDADPDAVAEAAIAGMNFTWSGQSCGSTSRVLLHERIADAVLERVGARLRDREYPTPLDPGSVQGTMVSRRQYDRVLGYLDLARRDGAEVVVGGGRPANADRGLFIAPTFLDRVDPASRVATEEIFGPVASVIRWEDEAEALRIANSVSYGLTGSVFTNDVRAAHRVAHELEAGFIWVNTVGPHYQGIPYGGWKNSGLGSEESLDELLSYTQVKAVNVRLS